MRKVYYLFILVIVVIFSVIGGIYLYLFSIPKTIYLQSVYTKSLPNIDGNFNSAEWASAFNMSFTLSTAYESRSGELFLLNNDTHLFIAFRILNEDYDGSPPSGSPDELTIWLDPNNNGQLDNYEDMKLLYTSSTPYKDAYHTSPAGGMYIYLDSVYGGTQDGYAFWNHTNPTGIGILTFEIIFPFLSTDPHDLNVTRGTTIGIDFEYWSLGTSYNFGVEWPGDRLKPQEWAKLVIG